MMRGLKRHGTLRHGTLRHGRILYDAWIETVSHCANIFAISVASCMMRGLKLYKR